MEPFAEDRANVILALCFNPLNRSDTFQNDWPGNMYRFGVNMFVGEMARQIEEESQLRSPVVSTR